ncbi:MAG: primosomal protein N' [Candidatus Gracilibacteria bacterium]|jgi:primosomal protein N' (replication factor Y)|nr:primosomal protein N' [Candidatus Gracilibacteria bacterium]
MKYAEILLPLKFSFDKETLTYKVPEDLPLQVGDLVSVEIKNKLKTGLVVEIHNRKPSFITKEILNKTFEDLSLSANQVEILKWVSKYYFCPLDRALKLFVPGKILNGKLPRKPKEKSEQFSNTDAKVLNEEQANCVESILSSKKNKFIIQGVTGSGKTEIYVTLAKKEIEKGNQVLILVPEISLTPQTVEYFESALKEKAKVFHSKLGESEKTNNWLSVCKNEAKLIIGSRSSIFAPFKSLSLIIIDEEHDGSYKQETSPRYNAKKVAEKISDTLNAKLVLGSATPSLETLESNNFEKLLVTKRINNSPMPEIEIVDLRDEFHKRNFSIFSERLKEEILTTLQKKEQAILFINRRGTASSMVCRDCGHTIKCDHCEMPMTFHEKNFSSPLMICHHCGKIEKPKNTCPNCKSPFIKQIGIGTERIEKDLIKEFPGIRVLRADKDTTSKKNGFKDIYDKFKKQEADILVGTQMIAKGLHLPKVNLVGIILADIGINIPDFRTNERIYQLITQVAGRSGREESVGKVIIQTYNPTHISLEASKKNDFNYFLDYERTQRKILKNPPYSSLAKIIVEDKFQKNSEKFCEELKNLLEKTRTQKDLKDIEISAYPAFIYKLKNKFRNIILIKNLNPENENIIKLLENIPKEYKLDARIKFDMDPLTIS